MQKFFLPLLVLCACTSSPNETNSPTEASHQGKVFEINGVYASSQFDGARLNNFEQLSDGVYRATIRPESIPVNASAWFAFKLWSKEDKTIDLELRYTHHQHRYIPKKSADGENWTPLELPVRLNADSTAATFTVNLSADTTWIAAQEVFSSKHSDIWTSQLLAKADFLRKSVAGKSVLGRDIMVLSSENASIEESAVIIARQHPPEVPGGTIAFQAFFEEVISSSDLASSFRERFNLYVFPLINPDGADLGNWRHNSNGVDLNRDWSDFTQPETQTARDFVLKKIEEEGKRISFGIDFHTSYNGPYLLILDSLNEANMRTRIIPQWRAGIDVDSLEMNDYRRRDQSLPYCYNWFYSLGAEAVTYEEGDENDRQVIRARARHYAIKWMESMLSNL